jgi:hypothetical protein
MVRGNRDGRVVAMLFDLQGNAVRRAAATSSKLTMNTAGLCAGTYLLRLLYGEGAAVQSMIISVDGR